MSIRAIDWVFRQSIKSATDKFVLVALADNAGDTGLAFPSVETICRKTSHDRKTVIASLDRLKVGGMIEDTGKRVGATKQVKVYRLAWAIENSPETGTVPVFPERVPVLPREPSENRKRNRPPKPPKGGEGSLLSPIWKKRLGAIFNRRESTVWNAKEKKALDAIVPVDDNELAMVEAYYRAERAKPDDKNYSRRDLLTLLNNWPGEVDRARVWVARQDSRKRRFGNYETKMATDVTGATRLLGKGPKDDADFKRVGDLARAELERFRAKMKPGVAPTNGE
jgi:hypothetical protein